MSILQVGLALDASASEQSSWWDTRQVDSEWGVHLPLGKPVRWTSIFSHARKPATMQQGGRSGIRPAGGHNCFMWSIISAALVPVYIVVRCHPCHHSRHATVGFFPSVRLYLPPLIVARGIPRLTDTANPHCAQI